MPNLFVQPIAFICKCLVLVLVGLLFSGPHVLAANRVVKISAPVSAVAGAEINVPIAVTTDAGGGEQIGFFHADFSNDGGKNWTGFCYAQNVGPSSKTVATLKAGAAGTKLIIRVRIAFRGGKAGDVDYNGNIIEWAGSWQQWKGPPAKYVIVPVVAP